MPDLKAARREWDRSLTAPNAGTSIGREFVTAAGWGLVTACGHGGCDGWHYGRETGLVCACGAVLDEPAKVAAGTALVGPLRPVRYADGRTEWHDLPRNTLDIRYAACNDHHLACDCREALLAEDTAEYRAMWQELEQAILDAIEGHQTYAFTGTDDSGWSGEDEYAQCKCPACVIARSVHIGFSECMRQHREAYERLAAESRERARAAFAAIYDGTDEVPF
jgi:hypothetical protein